MMKGTLVSWRLTLLEAMLSFGDSSCLGLGFFCFAALGFTRKLATGPASSSAVHQSLSP